MQMFCSFPIIILMEKIFSSSPHESKLPVVVSVSGYMCGPWLMICPGCALPVVQCHLKGSSSVC